MAVKIGTHLWQENLDLLTPPDSTLPPPQEPAEAIRQLPFKARLFIRASAWFIAKGSRTGAWTNPDDPHRDLLKPFVDPTYEDLRKDGLTVPHEAVDAYFRQAYRDAEEWYAGKRPGGEGGRSTPAQDPGKGSA
jgi:hypothetical protein